MKKDLQAKAYKLRKNLTPAELKLLLHICKKQLNGFRFRRQHIINPYIVDFYCHRAKLVIEIDGESHYAKEEYDLQRSLFLKNKGLKIIKFSNNEIYYNIEKILSIICHHLQTSI